MTRLRYWLLNFAAAVSLVMCVAAMVLWVRSFYVSDWVLLIHRHAPMKTTSAGVATWDGLVSLQVSLMAKSDYGDPRDTLFQYNPQPASGPWIVPFDRSAARLFGFGGSWESGRCLLIAPAWSVVLVSGAAAALCWRRLRQGRRARRMGLCPVCGYDLRATPDLCPECGTVPEKPAHAG